MDYYQSNNQQQESSMSKSVYTCTQCLRTTSNITSRNHDECTHSWEDVTEEYNDQVEGEAVQDSMCQEIYEHMEEVAFNRHQMQYYKQQLEEKQMTELEKAAAQVLTTTLKVDSRVHTEDLPRLDTPVLERWIVRIGQHIDRCIYVGKAWPWSDGTQDTLRLAYKALVVARALVANEVYDRYAKEYQELDYQHRTYMDDPCVVSDQESGVLPTMEEIENKLGELSVII